MNKETKLGDGVANEVKKEINRELSSMAKALIRILFAYLNDKVKGIDIDDILGKLSKKDEDEIISLWSSQLVEEGLLPSGYGGLPNDLLRLFGGFCGRDSGIGPAQRAKTTIWN